MIHGIAVIYRYGILIISYIHTYIYIYSYVFICIHCYSYWVGARQKLPMVFVSQSCGGAGSSPTHLRDCGLKPSLLHTIEGY